MSLDSVLYHYAHMRGYTKHNKSAPQNLNAIIDDPKASDSAMGSNVILDDLLMHTHPSLITPSQLTHQFAAFIQFVSELPIQDQASLKPFISYFYMEICEKLGKLLPENQVVDHFIASYSHLQSNSTQIPAVNRDLWKKLQEFIIGDFKDESQLLIPAIFASLNVDLIDEITHARDSPQTSMEHETIETTNANDDETMDCVDEDIAKYHTLIDDYTSSIECTRECGNPFSVATYTIVSSPSHITSACVSPSCIALSLENGSMVFTKLNPDSHRMLQSSQCPPAYQLQMPPINKVDSSFAYGDWTMSRGHTDTVYHCQFIPSQTEERYVLSCSGDATVRLWDLCRGGQCNYVYKGHSSPVWSVAIDQSPNVQYFATASLDTTCRVFLTQRLNPVRVLCGHDDSVDCVAFSPSGSGSHILATGSADGSIRVWTLNDLKPIRLLAGVPAGASIQCLSFSPCGRYLSGAVHNNRVYIWEVGSGRLVSLSGPGDWHQQQTTKLDWIKMEDGREYIISCGIDSKFRAQSVNHAKLSDQFSKVTLPASSLLSLNFSKQRILAVGTSQ